MTSCNVYRDNTLDIRKCRTFGCIVSFLSCGVTMAYDEAIRAEGMRPITRHLLRAIIHGAKMPEGIIYDAACTLDLHWKKFLGTNLLRHSVNTNQLPKRRCVDFFHIRTHTRPMCKTIMRPDDPVHEGLFTNVNTQMAEQSFSFLSQFKSSLRNFTHPRSTTMLMILLHLKNCDIVGVRHTDQGIASRYLPELIKPYYPSSIARLISTANLIVPVDQTNDTNDEQSSVANQAASVDESIAEHCSIRR